MALSFDGVNDKVTHGRMTVLESLATFSIAWWVSVQPSSTSECLASKDSCVRLRRINATGNAQFHPAGTDAIFANGPLYDAVAWFHAVWVFNGAGGTDAQKIQLYKNGIPVTLSFTGTIPTTLGAGTGNMVVSATTAGTEFQNYPKAHIKMWSAALTAAEAYQEMETARPQRMTNLILWSPYDDALLARDYSQTGNDGTTTDCTQVAGPYISYGGR